MRSIQLLYFLIGFSVFAGCSQKSEQQSTGNKTAGGQTSIPDTTKSKGGHDYTFLTFKMLQYNASVISGLDPKEQPYKGQWIKMDSDGTFKAGKYKEQTHTGAWTYNHDARVLLLQPNDKDFKTSEWKILFNDDMIVFIGTDSYGNSGTQIQLIRIEKFPEKEF